MSLDRWNEVYVRRGLELGVDQGDFIVALDEEHVYALTPAAYYVWALCDGSTPLGAIVENIAESLPDQKVEDIYNAVVRIIDELMKVGLVEKASGEKGAG